MGKTKTLIIYDSDSRPGKQLHSQSSPGDLAVVERQRDGKISQNGKLGHSCVRVTKGRLYECRVRYHVVHLGLNVSSSILGVLLRPTIRQLEETWA